MVTPPRVGTLYPTYRSKFGPKYNTVPNVAGWTVSQVIKLGVRAGGFGAAAGIAALFYTSGIPRIQKDILQKIPILGNQFVKEVHPADNTKGKHSIMKAIEAYVDGLNLLSIVVLYTLLWLITPRLPNPTPSGPKTNKLYDGLMRVSYSIIFIVGWAWCSNVMSHVEEPYLDEVFHIPQAQKFCQGRWTEWDDKITTPPGLYVLSKYYLAMMLRPECSVLDLRGVNIIAIIGLGILATHCRHLIETRRNDAKSSAPPVVLSFYSIHTGWNIALFPVLFFFSGLYYTDVVSTLSVLVAYYHHLRRVREGRSSFLSDLTTIILGVVTLTMRQTNVFWVVVYMGGLEAVSAVKSLRPAPAKKPEFGTLLDCAKYYGWRYSLGDIHDPPLNTAWPDDLVVSALSIGVAAIFNPFRVLKKVWPHITIMGLFAGFVAWNGGVVLGDKSNHVATIHLAQMLYIWPMFAFFSFPLFLPSAISILRFAHGLFTSVFGTASTKETSKVSTKNPTTGANKDEPTKKSPQVSAAYALLQTIVGNKLYQLALTPFLIALTLLVVKFNTIIHPFTLADNRHYMFYVFRYTIRRPGLFRYYLVIPYTFARWLCWDALSGCGQGGFLSDHTQDCSGQYSHLRPGPFDNSPFSAASSQSRPEKPPSTDALQSEVASEKEGEDAKYHPYALIKLDEPTSNSTEPTSSSTAILLLLATTLSLMTAPLVEPRYFILPWVFWRLLIPAWKVHEHAVTHPVLRKLEGLPIVGAPVRFSKKFDVRLVLETLWFILVNLVTMYIFIAKPYKWRDENGRILDGGRMQRFMW
ncbi:Dol-P-Glc:Glc(2)Man(9)GlcNAc(2)-PP-Dol alpha-1,2-glucosyltransferase [Colletotrichum sp. SAR 10_99]|nr:Dol-P-Glc:Glc(2)Man(9)GlcNAc(2)-PP-Dol alpha-1,2-glucosyltransferase [Colletotrichum sp. SAR 10_96]KAJ5012691.1 Dol-P-Glc:Glc(2)Man(9)GlcNAc(2)-PP-Dol alpha-1,2-glucosyltransferase [Colletotrichum sp. SAR 10_99]